MSKIDRALAGNPFRVDQTQCLLAGSTLGHYSATSGEVPWSHASTAAKVVFKLFFVSICHQINWDFLQSRMAQKFLSAEPREMIERARDATPSYVGNLLEGYHRPERIRSAERAKYLRETALSLVEVVGEDVLTLVQEKRIFGQGGLMEILLRIRAFSEDPLSKKANALAQELARERIVLFDDAEKIPPAIDYHLIRLYLRTGRVVPTSKDIFPALTAGVTHRMRLLKLLREAVAEALLQTAAAAKLPVHEVNYVEWQLGRNRCERESTNCDGPWPVELDDISIKNLSQGCPLRESCNAYSMRDWMLLVEPEMRRAFY